MGNLVVVVDARRRCCDAFCAAMAPARGKATLLRCTATLPRRLRTLLLWRAMSPYHNVSFVCVIGCWHARSDSMRARCRSPFVGRHPYDGGLSGCHGGCLAVAPDRGAYICRCVGTARRARTCCVGTARGGRWARRAVRRRGAWGWGAAPVHVAWGRRAVRRRSLCGHGAPCPYMFPRLRGLPVSAGGCLRASFWGLWLAGAMLPRESIRR